MPWLSRALTALAAVLLFILPLSFGQKAQDPAGEVKKVVSRLQFLRCFRANISFTNEANTDRNISGVLSYEDGKSHIKLQDARVVATNGIYMIAYNPTMAVGAKQLVGPATGGAGWLLDFHYELLSAREALGRAEHAKARFQKVRLEWGEKHLLTRLSLLPRNSENWLHLRLSNVRELTSFSPSLFSYRPPTGSRTVENALNRRN